MAVFGRRKKKKQKQAEKTARRAYNSAMKEQAALRREEMQRDIFQTTEGQGIMEGATISLGYDEDEEDDELFRSGTGLII